MIASILKNEQFLLKLCIIASLVIADVFSTLNAGNGRAVIKTAGSYVANSLSIMSGLIDGNMSFITVIGFFPAISTVIKIN